MEKENIEYINKLRIEFYNSKEYNLGRRMLKTKELIKKGKLIQLLKLSSKSRKIKKLSSKENLSFSQINNNRRDYRKAKIVVYTCITGSYDKVKEPLFLADNIDYVLFTDDTSKISQKDTKWTIKDLTKENIKKLSMANKNRFVKLQPHYFFKDKYDYSIYIDGNIQVVSDIRDLINSVNENIGFAMHLHRNRDDIYSEYKVCNILKKGNKDNLIKQVARYKKDKFPKKYGMLEANIFVVDLKNKESEIIFSQWWNEFITSNSGRDQISLPYVLWKNNIKISDVASLGSDVYSNPRFCIYLHRKDENI